MPTGCQPKQALRVHWLPIKAKPCSALPLPPPPQDAIGTSFAAPLVAGVAGLVLAAQNFSGSENVNNNWDIRDVKNAILDGADVLPQLAAALPDGQQLIHGGRRLNAYNALAEYFGDPSQFPRLPPELSGKKPQPPPPQPPPPQVKGC